MSSILYYSNFCEPSKKLLQTITKSQNVKDIHFICIDNRVKDSSGKTYIILQNGQKIVMPENVTRVPALMLLNQNYKVLYGDEIYQHLKPMQEVEVRKATQNNMVPTAFDFGSFAGFGSGIVSDTYSFLDQNDTELSTSGNGGMRQMHSYVSLNDSGGMSMHLPKDDHEYKSDKVKEGSVEALIKQREMDLKNVNYAQSRPGGR
jgi:hypothetical protein